MGAVALGGACDGRHGDCVASLDHRRLQRHQTSHSAGLFASAANFAHQRKRHRANLHAIYAETDGKVVSRDELSYEHFSAWTAWAKEREIGLDFNPTYFAHPMAATGYTLSSADPKVQSFWIRHGIVCRYIASEIATALGGECVINHWIPDGAKDATVDRWGPRRRLIEAYDEILNEPLPNPAWADMRQWLTRHSAPAFSATRQRA